MPQFFLPEETRQGSSFHLRGPEAFHISRVLRRREGDAVTLFDGKGGRFEGVIRRIHPDGSVSGDIQRALPGGAPTPPVRLRLYQGVLRPAPWDYVLEKGTELGVSAFAPVLTPRTVVLYRDDEKGRAKRRRWERVVMAATKQCGREVLPAVEAPQEFRDAVKSCGAAPGVTLMAWEGLAGATAQGALRDALRSARERQGSGELRVNLFVGPTGGFSEEEVELAESLGVALFGMGSLVLRAETAAIAACALVRYETGFL